MPTASRRPIEPEEVANVLTAFISTSIMARGHPVQPDDDLEAVGLDSMALLKVLLFIRSGSDAGRMVGSRGLSLRRADAGSPAGRAWLDGRRIDLPQERGATSHRTAHRATSIRRAHDVALQPGPAPHAGASRGERDRARRAGDPLNAGFTV